ncbi:MAG TPA: Ig-like domain-containing protein [Gemmatimonadales bacterium]
MTACSSGCTTGGGTASAITVTARDASNNPIQGLTVVLSASGSGGNFTAPTTTNASGVSTSTFTSTSAEAKTISATISGVGITQTASVTVNPAAVSAGQSTVGAAPTSITACNASCTTGGGTGSLITVTAKDQFGNVIQGATVTLGSNGANNNFTAPGTTNSSGVATSTFSSSTAESKTISATINAVAITQKPTVTVNPAAVSAAQSTVTAGQSTMTACLTSCTTGGGTASLITVTAKDAFGNAIPGATVVLSSTGSNNSFTAPGSTNSVGVATSTFTSTKAESKTVSATINSAGITQTASVTVNPAAASHLTFTVDPSNTPAGNDITPPVEVTALDQFNNVATGFTGEVVMAIGNDGSGGSGVLTYTAPVNASAGVATFSDLKITPSGNGYTLVASATGLTSATSPGFNITP